MPQMDGMLCSVRNGALTKDTRASFRENGATAAYTRKHIAFLQRLVGEVRREGGRLPSFTVRDVGVEDTHEE